MKKLFFCNAVQRVRQPPFQSPRSRVPPAASSQDENRAGGNDPQSQSARPRIRRASSQRMQTLGNRTTEL
jgi:hypothetical protein